MLSILKRFHRRVRKILGLGDTNEWQNVSLGKGVHIGPDSVISGVEVAIGDYTRIYRSIHIRGYQRVEIGKYCAIGANVRIISNNHQMNHANVQVDLQRRLGFVSLMEDRGPIIIGNNVWIGDMATFLPGVHVGDGAVIGACSLVTKDVPPFSVAVGVPARIVRKRFAQDVIDALLSVKWWNWPPERMEKNREFFESDLTDCTAYELRSLIV